MSVIECVSAAGRKLRCVAIFKGQGLQTTWFPAEIPNWLYTTSENAWTSQEIGLEWLQRVFIPESTPQLNQHRMLLLDAHSSHINIEFLWSCKQHKIELLFLPAHSTHVLQPLDLSVFSAAKTRYRNQIRDLASLDDAAPVKKQQFIRYYNLAREDSITERVIRAGWRAAGLVPYNPDLVTTSSQMLDQPLTPPAALQRTDVENILYRTPQRPQDLYAAQQSLQKSKYIARDVRQVLQKASKALGKFNSELAAQQVEISRLEYLLEASNSTRKRKRITVDQNQRFADLDAVAYAVEKAAASKARSTRSTKKRKASATKKGS